MVMEKLEENTLKGEIKTKKIDLKIILPDKVEKDFFKSHQNYGYLGINNPYLSIR